MMLGLAHQRRTGEGQYVSLSMLGGNALCYSDDFCRWDGKAPRSLTDEENHGLGALYRLYQVSDGWVFLAAPTEREWTSLLKALDATSLSADERFATADARRANDAALAAELGALLSPPPAAELEASLSEAGVGCAVASEDGASAVTSTDPVLFETGLTVDVDHPLFGRIRRHAPPVAFSETPGPSRPQLPARRAHPVDPVRARLLPRRRRRPRAGGRRVRPRRNMTAADIALRYLEHANRGDAEAAEALEHPDIHFWLSGRLVVSGDLPSPSIARPRPGVHDTFPDGYRLHIKTSPRRTAGSPSRRRATACWPTARATRPTTPCSSRSRTA